MAANLIGGFLFSAVGFVALVYGKKQGSPKPMVLGALLLVFPYFVPNTLALYGIGLGLTAALFIFRG